MKMNEGKTRTICFSRVPDNELQLNGGDIPFLNNVTYLGVTFDRRMTWRQHSERTVAKALNTYVRAYCPFKSRLLITNIKLLFKIIYTGQFCVI
jgi:hypothetical protein